MRGVVQRVTFGEVRVDGESTGRIDAGVCVLVGVGHDDDHKDAAQLAAKVVGLRIFPDSDDKMNLSVREMSGKVLAVSQFTLHGDARKGKRPSFIKAMAPEPAESLFNAFCDACRQAGVPVETGRFGADMQIELRCDGPVTILLDTKRLF